MNGFFNAIRHYHSAFHLIARLKLGVYFLIPAIVSLIVGIGLLFSIIHLGDNFGAWMGTHYPFETGAIWFAKVAQWVGYILISILAIILFRYIIMMFLSPFLSPLSAKVEKHYMQTNDAGWSLNQLSSEIIRSIRLNIRNLMKELLLTLLLIILGFIPVIGWFAGLLILLVQAYFSGFQNMDFTMERHFNMQESIRFVNANRGLAIGNGLIFIGMLMIPVLGVILGPPLAVIAATVGVMETMEHNPGDDLV